MKRRKAGTEGGEKEEGGKDRGREGREERKEERKGERKEGRINVYNLFLHILHSNVLSCTQMFNVMHPHVILFLDLFKKMSVLWSLL